MKANRKWLILLIVLVLPAGLLLGLAGAALVDPKMVVDPDLSVGGAGNAANRERRDLPEPDLNAAYREARDDDPLEERQSSYRPQLDYDEEIWDQDLADLRYDETEKFSRSGSGSGPAQPDGVREERPSTPSSRYRGPGAGKSAGVPGSREHERPVVRNLPERSEPLPAIY